MLSNLNRIVVVLIMLSGIGVNAAITITRVNATTIGLYEKFEAVYRLDGLTYDNPYDPEQIDVTAVFTSPSGKPWHLFGFFDDYRHVSEWKVRFSPNEIGMWSYVITANNADGAQQSEVRTFTAVQSPHHGWIKPATENPHYLVHDDGAPFYGVGMYTPWGNSIEEFDELKKYGGNTFAIWNITYGGMVNGYGLIEEQLGRYNQMKCGKIDTLLQVAEARDLTMMFCFWPHDLFSATVWAHQWHQNPYRFVCDVVDVYSDQACWEYQEKQYRYLIARFSYSRAMGIWEMMNEINGTDGWAAGRHDEAKEWVHKVDHYFKENDAFQHPTTASRSGGFGEYWLEMYDLIDLPNIHVYESQGWPTPYLGNTLRSSMENYAFATQRFWNAFAKPAIFGEAGADLVTVALRSPDYTAMYHNAIWASLTNGLAATPYWWTFSDPIRNVEREQMAHLAKFVADIDFVKDSREHFAVKTDDYDLFGMRGDSTAFGWMRQIYAQDITRMQFDLQDVLRPDIPVYAVSYYDPWNGKEMGTTIRPHVDGQLRDIIPPANGACPDIAFKIKPAQGGVTPALLELSADQYRILNIDTLTCAITCYLFDRQSRFCPQAEAIIAFSLQGVGDLIDSPQVTAKNGVAVVHYRPSAESGEARIIASSSGLAADTLVIRVQDRTVLDDFEVYHSDSQLKNYWVTKSGKADISLAPAVGHGQFAIKVDYGIGGDYQYTAVIEKQITHSFKGGRYLTFWLQHDDSKREIEIRIYNVNRKFWTYTFSLSGSESGIMTIPLSDFETRDASIPFDLSILETLRLTIKAGDGGHGAGTLYFDDFSFPTAAPSAVDRMQNEHVPSLFNLHPNYPNPFNEATRIDFQLGEKSPVEICIFNIQGQLVETLVNVTLDAGTHSTVWETGKIRSSGLYFIQMVAGDVKLVVKCLLSK
ncbi:MAG: DUF5060 domain-containing protein [Calditrichaeota bacterium]|nr:MAG: DUF5060 domain-containing protein [Calditrichota bacterium]